MPLVPGSGAEGTPTTSSKSAAAAASAESRTIRRSASSATGKRPGDSAQNGKAMNATKPLVIIPAAGSQSRWGDIPDVNKLLLPVHGEALLKRTQRQISERGLSYAIQADKDAATALPDTGIGHSVSLWQPDRRLLILFGDVAWSDEALNRVVAEAGDETKWFGRLAGGKHNRNREMFGLSLHPKDQERFRQAMIEFSKLRPPGLNCGGWQVYRMMQGWSWDKDITNDNLVIIDDETDDFDNPQQFRQWRALFETHSVK